MLAWFTVVFLFPGSLSASDSKAPRDAHSPTEKHLLWIWQSRVYIYSAAALLLGFCFFLQVARRKVSFKEAGVHVSGVKIFYGSQTGTAKGFASELSEEVQTLGIPVEVIDMKDYDPDDRLADEV
uniref:S-adenosyl-L-methionine-dependent tRNA 4-demethylwyosine synthase-like n=1 Tax=Fundulus heteroclitus TaxID=8078 RepID=A0A3Q2PLV6_FUNHE